VEGWRWPIAHVAARQPKWRTVGRAAAYHILWVRGIGDHTISRRGFNLFKQLRRHFRATPFCSHALSRRDPGDQNASVPKIDDRLGGLLREGGRGASESRKFAAGQSLSGMGDRHDGREGKLRVAIFCLSVPFLIHRKRYHTFCRSQCKNRSHLISLINLLLARHCANTARSLSHIYYGHMHRVPKGRLNRPSVVGKCANGRRRSIRHDPEIASSHSCGSIIVFDDVRSRAFKGAGR
jgi:hypothetical protein